MNKSIFMLSRLEAWVQAIPIGTYLVVCSVDFTLREAMRHLYQANFKGVKKRDNELVISSKRLIFVSIYDILDEKTMGVEINDLFDMTGQLDMWKMLLSQIVKIEDETP
jgi:hypothetical protein